MNQPPEIKKAINVEGYKELVTECITRNESPNEASIAGEGQTSAAGDEPGRRSRRIIRRWLAVLCLFELLVLSGRFIFNEALPAKQSKKAALDELSLKFGKDYDLITRVSELLDATRDATSFDSANFLKALDQYTATINRSAEDFSHEFADEDFLSENFQKKGKSIEYLEPLGAGD